MYSPGGVRCTTKAIRNSSHYNNPEYDKLAEAQDVEVDLAKRKAIITQAQQLHTKDEPYWQLYMLPTIYVYNARRFPDLKAIPPFGFQFALPQLLDLTPADPSHKTLVFCWFQDFTSWNIFAESSAGRRCYQRHVYDTFTRISYDGKLIPWAAESWNVVDPTTRHRRRRGLQLQLLDQMAAALVDGRDRQPAERRKGR